MIYFLASDGTVHQRNAAYECAQYILDNKKSVFSLNPEFVDQMINSLDPESPIEFTVISRCLCSIIQNSDTNNEIYETMFNELELNLDSKMLSEFVDDAVINSYYSIVNKLNNRRDYGNNEGPSRFSHEEIFTLEIVLQEFDTYKNADFNEKPNIMRNISSILDYIPIHAINKKSFKSLKESVEIELQNTDQSEIKSALELVLKSINSHNF